MSPSSLPLVLIVAGLALIQASLVSTTQVVSNAVVLSQAEGSCDKPIKNWIAVVISLYSFKLLLLLALFGLLISNVKQDWGKWTLAGGYILTEVATLGWAILGSVWMDDSDSCESGMAYSDLKDAYLMTLATVVVSYVVAGVVFCCVGCCTCCIWLGSGLMATNKKA